MSNQDVCSRIPIHNAASMSMSHAASLREAIAFHIRTIEYEAGTLQRLLKHVPHTTEWHPSSGFARPGPIDDLVYIYHRHRFLHRGPLQDLFRALCTNHEFVKHATLHLQEQTADLDSLERLTRTYAHIATYVHREFVAAQGCDKWSRKTGLPMHSERCSTLYDILQVHLDWVMSLADEGKSLDRMAENTYIHRLRPAIELLEKDQDQTMQQIATIWSDECKRNRPNRIPHVYSTGFAIPLPPQRSRAVDDVYNDQYAH